jgi:uncharacterized protein DUF87/type IV secretory system conjugative DNA transfer VirD4/TraG family protein
VSSSPLAFRAERNRTLVGSEESREQWENLLTLRCESVSGNTHSTRTPVEALAPRAFLESLRPGERLVVSLSASGNGHQSPVHWDLGVRAVRRATDLRRGTLRDELSQLARLLGSGYQFCEVKPEPTADRVRTLLRARAWELPLAARPAIGFTSGSSVTPAPARILISAAVESKGSLGMLVALLQRTSPVEIQLSFEPVQITDADRSALSHAAAFLDGDAVMISAGGQDLAVPLVEASVRQGLRAQVGSWLAGARCIRLGCEVASQAALPETIISAIGTTLWPGTVVSTTVHTGRRSALLDLSNCYSLGSLSIDVVPSVAALRESGTRSHFLSTAEACADSGIVLGAASDGVCQRPVRFALPDRTRHAYIIGGTGTGKTTLLRSMAQQDIEEGRGVCVIDPHGPLTEELLEGIPAHRAADVVVIDPSDAVAPIGLNLLDCSGPTRAIQINFAVNELIKILDRLYDLRLTGGPMFEQYFRNALLLLMDSEIGGATLMDVPLVFEDSDYRAFLKRHCLNPSVERFWSRQAEAVMGDHALVNMGPYITSKINQFTTNAVLRPILGQAAPKLDIAEAMRERRIVLVNLSKGLIGELDAQLLGMLFVGKLFICALARRTSASGTESPFHLYIDEFQNFVTDTVAHMLAEARKFGLSLTLANQTLSQLSVNPGRHSVLDAVLGNCGSLLCFRVGPIDAERLQTYTQPELSARDLQNLPDFHAAMRLLVNNRPAPPFVLTTAPYRPVGPSASVEALKLDSRKRYGRAPDETEAAHEARRGAASLLKSRP